MSLKQIWRTLFGSADETIDDYLGESQFYLPKPKPPLKDARAWGLALPAIVGLGGLAAFAILGFVAPELEWLAKAFRTNTALWGAIFLAIGGEVGTLATNIEIFRKVGNGEATNWDWSAFITSLIATILSFLLGTAALLPTAPWSSFALIWLRIGLILAAAFDQYAGQMELGLYCSSYDRRFKQWEDKFKEWREGMARAYGAAVPIAGQVVRAQPVSELQEPTAEQQAAKILPVEIDLGEWEDWLVQEGNGWRASCPVCDWKSEKKYDNLTKAKNGASMHKQRWCKGEKKELKEEIELPPETVDDIRLHGKRGAGGGVKEKNGDW